MLASRWINWLRGIFAAISDLYWQFWGNGFHWIPLFADPGFQVVHDGKTSSMMDLVNPLTSLRIAII